jgi:hypothetical protein
MTKLEFLRDVQNWNNHLYLLWGALENTEGPVVEMGMGHGSTPFLHEYCKDAGRELYSYETDKNWMDKFKNLANGLHTHGLVHDWDLVHQKHKFADVVLIDHAPGERRKEDIELWRFRCEYLVAHDTEPAADGGYKMRERLAFYRFLKDYKTEGAWATVVSMKNDVSKF